MAEPTEAERTRAWDLIEQIGDEAVKPEVDWPRVRRWAQELTEHVDSFLGRAGS